MKKKNEEHTIMIEKASGQTELFSETKLRRSLRRSGASVVEVDQVVEDITSVLKTGASTQQIYKNAFSLLKKRRRSIAGRYSLKKAILDLGPSGFAFEKYISELLALDGFSVQQGVMVKGACVSHEVDVVAEKDNQHIMVECKFHNQAGIRSDIKVALYIQARFEDIEKAWKKKTGHAQKFHEVWLVTNTKLSSDAIRYAECVGMKAIGWDYPIGKGLERRVDDSGLHPITCLTSMGKAQKQQLLGKGIVLCKQLLQNKKAIRSLGYSASKRDAIVKEIHQLCHLP